MRFKNIISSLLVLGAGLAFGAWLSGLLLYAAEVRLQAEPAINAAMPAAEAIVVLTGGSERLTTGIELLKAGKGRKLLISGVYPGLTPGNVLANQSVPQELRDCCITLGHAAGNTEGNAEETRAWIKAENFHSLRLVTAHYHMPRSLIIFRKALPGIEIIPHPVSPDSVKMSRWWLRPGTASLLIGEYNKYLYTLAREAWDRRK